MLQCVALLVLGAAQALSTDVSAARVSAAGATSPVTVEASEHRSPTLRVNGLFSDGMVLQTNYEGGLRPFLHGSAAPGEVVTLTGAPSRTKGKSHFSATADATGRWVMQLDPHIQAKTDPQAGFTLTLSGSLSPRSTIVARNVVYGDVFLCSGQVCVCVCV